MKNLKLMTHVVVGYPSIAETRALVNMMVQEGVDMIELQIPFSDPIGDGPTIHKANTASLAAGTHVRDAFELVRILREEDHVTIPLLFMTYLNIAYTYGLEKFCRDAQKVGINGLIIPDYNLEHEKVDHLDSLAQKHNLDLIRFVSLDSSEERMKELGRGAQGFVYCFSTRGVTGAREDLDTYIKKHLKRVRKYFAIPLGVGFGISKAEHVTSLKGSADMVIVGSAMIKAYEDGGLESARRKMQELIVVCNE